MDIPLASSHVSEKWMRQVFEVVEVRAWTLFIYHGASSVFVITCLGTVDATRVDSVGVA